MKLSVLGSFLSSISKTKIESVAQSLTQKLTQLDPKAATEAQKRMLNDKLQICREKLVKAKTALKRDKDETKTWQAKAKSIEEALTILKNQHKNATDKAGILKKAKQLRASLDNSEMEIVREKSEDKQCQEIVDRYQSIYDQLLKKKDEMATALQNAQRNVDAAEAHKESAQLREQQEKEMNSLEGDFGEMNLVLDSLNASAEKAHTEATMANMSADEMASSGNTGDEDLLNDVLEGAAKKSKDVDDPFAGI